MKHKGHLAGALMMAAMLAGCGTVVRTLPLPPSATAADATGVTLYFGSQAHPAVKTAFGERSESVRVKRATEAEQPTCELALGEALGHLRDYAKRRGANAVVDVKTRFHDNRSDSPTSYTCGVSGSAGAIAVSGNVVLLDVQ
ncbi:signal peptidase [Burkholderia sp. SRS-46]|nr:signal peptidase [Burkholderia sp. SRS-46]